MNLQAIVAGIIIACAAFYLVKRMMQSSKGHSCDSSDCKHAGRK